MTQPDPTTESACRLAELRGHIEDLLDSDHLLPADGRALLEMLQQAKERIAVEDIAEARGLLLGFQALLKALLDTGSLNVSAGRCCIVEAHIAAVSLSKTSA